MERCLHCHYGPSLVKYHGYCSADCTEHAEDSEGIVMNEMPNYKRFEERCAR